MSGEPGFEDFGSFGDPPPEGSPQGDAPGGASAAHSAGPWFVRFAGRRSGPFDAERLRTLARRGALTRMHSLSVDGKRWTQATAVRAVFDADGSVARSGAASGIEVEEDSFAEAFPDTGPMELPLVSAARRAVIGSAFVRPVVLCALALATVMLALPTSRD